MDGFEKMYTWFEHIIRSNESETGINYAAVEAVVSRRIHECEERGILGLLCIDEIPDLERFEQIERDLFTQITQYCEYDEPVNECLRYDIDFSEREWDRISRKLDERLVPVMQLPLWEQQILAPEEHLSGGAWETIEAELFERINRADSRIHEYWEPYEVIEEPVSPHSMEIAEDLLDRHIRSVASRQPWEHILAADKILPMSRWEHIERTFFSSIVPQQQISLDKQPFWVLIGHYASLFKGVAITGVAVTLLVVVGIGIKTYQENFTSLPTVVYQTDGNAVGHIDMTSRISEECSVVQGGGVTLVNSHGSIELRDNSALKIEKLSNRQVKYRVKFSSAPTATDGNVSFFVRRTNKRQNFSVATEYYNIEVKGTYFRVESDINGSISTKVLEGTVKITDSPLGDTLLQAGQSLKYDPTLNKYRIVGGGAVVSRDELEKMPQLNDLLRYAVITVTCSTPGSEISLNGKQYGQSPLRLRLPPGEYRTIVSRNDFSVIDTILSIVDVQEEYRFDFTLHPSEQIVKATKKSEMITEQHEPETVAKNTESPPPASRDSIEILEITQLYNNAQREEQNSNWRKAISLYQQVFDHPNTTPLRREDVLFSIGKLQAEHISNIEIAKRTFLTYLALFPSGSFAGESWLRLAELEFRKNQEQAITYYLRFFKQFPRHPRIAELQDRVGVIYLQKKQFFKATAMFEQALTSVGLSEDEAVNIASHLHRALLDCGETARAETVRTQYLLSDK